MGHSFPSFCLPSLFAEHTHTHTRYTPVVEPAAGGGCALPLLELLSNVCAHSGQTLRSWGLPLLVSEAIFVNMSAILYHLYQWNCICLSVRGNEVRIQKALHL
jgi:hypothetical protein